MRRLLTFSSQMALLYVAYLEDSLDSIHDALNVFCMASSARINWTESAGIPIVVEGDCIWGQDVGFMWLRPGQSRCYVGIDISATQQFEPVLASIRRKLCHWSTTHLSLADRALVVN